MGLLALRHAANLDLTDARNAADPERESREMRAKADAALKAAALAPVVVDRLAANGSTPEGIKAFLRDMFPDRENG